jgi:quinoprotein glucose dehydrogenase
MFYALNTKNKKILWEYQINAAGSATPTIFKHKDKQYVAVVSTGGAYFNYKEKDSAIYIFALN